MELHRREQLKLFTTFQHVINLVLLQKKKKKSLLFPRRTRAGKEGRFQERKVTARTVVFRVLYLQLKVPPKI